MATDRKEYQHKWYLKKKEEYRQKYLENREAKLKKAHENYVEKREGILAYKVEYHKKTTPEFGLTKRIIGTRNLAGLPTYLVDTPETTVDTTVSAR